jgi:hypothetical protein
LEVDCKAIVRVRIAVAAGRDASHCPMGLTA